MQNDFKKTFGEIRFRMRVSGSGCQENGRASQHRVCVLSITLKPRDDWSKSLSQSLTPQSTCLADGW